MTAPLPGGAAATSGAPGENVAGPYDATSRVLAELPRPRPVRVSRQGRTFRMVAVMVMLASLGIYAAGGVAARRAVGGRYKGPSQFPVFALSIAFIAVFAVVTLNMVGKQKRLLAEGEMAMARVTKRSMGRNGPNIFYEFTTPLGEHVSRGAPDSSRKLDVGMIVPIFYDARSPKKQLALCASFYEVVLPGNE